jgi:hypothetical protein
MTDRPDIIDRMADVLRTGAETRGWVVIADLRESFAQAEIEAHGPEAAFRIINPNPECPLNLEHEACAALMERLRSRAGALAPGRDDRAA